MEKEVHKKTKEEELQRKAEKEEVWRREVECQRDLAHCLEADYVAAAEQQ